MISFFRKIRQNLLQENRVTRYLAYALGEIVLVGFGILLALQVNNWNEQRKNRIQELELLKSVQSDLKRDLADIDGNVYYQRKSAHSGRILLQAMKDQIPYSDSLGAHFAQVFLPTSFLYSTSTFETIKSKGVDLIKNVDLRKKMIEVFDSNYAFFLQNETEFHQYQIHGMEHVFPGRFEEVYRFDLSNQVDIQGKMVPLDYQALSRDQEFLFYFKSYLNRNAVFVEVNYKKLRSEVVQLSDLLNQEISSRESR